MLGTWFTPNDLSAIAMSLRVSICAVVVSLVPSVMLAVWLARSRSPLKSLVETLLVVPLVLPPVVTGIGLLWLASSVNLAVAGRWWAAAIASALVSAPLLIRTVRATVETIDPRLSLAAATLGASGWRILWTITLPRAWPAVVGGSMLAWARAVGEFGATLVLAGNIAGKTQTIPMAMYTGWQATDRSLWPLVSVSVALALFAVAMGEWLVRRARSSETHATH